jgi:SAM-dependent methyltransferase
MKFEYVNCNLCGPTKTKGLGKRRGPEKKAHLETNIVRCSKCGLLYPNPMPFFSSDEIQKNFGEPEEYFSPDRNRRLELFENVLRRIEKIKPGKGRLLDVGCGRGEFLYAACKKGWEATGTDISEAFVNYARREFNVNALAGDIDDMDLAKGSFDVTCLISVIQYLRDPMKAFKNIHSLLKKDGILYIEATNEDALVFRLGDIFKSIKEKRKITTHLSPLFPSFQIYGFNKQSLKAALESTGFEVFSIRTGGAFGGGKVRGRGPGNRVLNFAQKIVVLIGGLTGKGHLLFCMARKK